MDEPQTGTQTGGSPVAASAPWRAERLAPKMIQILLSLRRNKNLANHVENIGELHTLVIALLQDPHLEHEPLTVVFITLEFGEAVLPYTLTTLASHVGPLPADVRETLRTHLRQAETLVTSHSVQSGKVFALEEGEIIHTRYDDLLANLRSVTDLLDRWR